MPKTYDISHKVKYYECDMTKQVSVPMLLNLAILVSNMQSEDLQVGDDFVHERGMGWIVLQYDIDIKRRPMVDEVVTLRTMARKFNAFFANRDFVFIDADGEEIIKIHSLFSLMDMEKRKLVRIPKEMVQGYEPEVVKRISRGEAPASITDDDVIAYEKQYGVRYTDIDFNLHVNNSHYFDWMIDVLDVDFLNQHEITTMNIRFEKEVSASDTVTSQAVMNDEQTQSKHRILFSDGGLATEAVINWTNK